MIRAWHIQGTAAGDLSASAFCDVVDGQRVIRARIRRHFRRARAIEFDLSGRRVWIGATGERAICIEALGEPGAVIGRELSARTAARMLRRQAIRDVVVVGDSRTGRASAIRFRTEPEGRTFSVHVESSSAPEDGLRFGAVPASPASPQTRNHDSYSVRTGRLVARSE